MRSTCAPHTPTQRTIHNRDERDVCRWVDGSAKLGEIPLVAAPIDGSRDAVGSGGAGLQEDLGDNVVVGEGTQVAGLAMLEAPPLVEAPELGAAADREGSVADADDPLAGVARVRVARPGPPEVTVDEDKDALHVPQLAPDGGPQRLLRLELPRSEAVDGAQHAEHLPPEHSHCGEVAGEDAQLPGGEAPAIQREAQRLPEPPPLLTLRHDGAGTPDSVAKELGVTPWLSACSWVRSPRCSVRPLTRR